MQIWSLIKPWPAHPFLTDLYSRERRVGQSMHGDQYCLQERVWYFPTNAIKQNCLFCNVVQKLIYLFVATSYHCNEWQELKKKYRRKNIIKIKVKRSSSLIHRVESPFIDWDDDEISPCPIAWGCSTDADWWTIKKRWRLQGFSKLSKVSRVRFDLLAKPLWVPWTRSQTSQHPKGKLFYAKASFIGFIHRQPHKPFTNHNR